MKGWVTKRLGDVCEIKHGFAFKSEFFANKGKYVVLTPGNYYEAGGYRDRGEKQKYYTGEIPSEYIMAEGDMLVVMTEQAAGLLGSPLLVPESDKYLHNQRLGLVIPKPGIPRCREFFFHLFNTESVRKAIHESASGVKVRHTSPTKIGEVEVSFPTSLAEQQRIVGLLDEAFEGLATAKANAEKNLQNARALFESHLQSVFTQRGPGWVETTVGEIGKVSMCKRIFKEETTATGDIPFYKIGTFGKEPDAFIPNQTYKEYRAKYSFPKKGDVLISASGTIGRRVRYDGEPAYFQDSNIVWIDNDEKQALNDYLFHFYEACEWNSSKGATISRLYNDDLRRIAIGFPKSLQEQRRIVAQLDALYAETQRLARLYERKLAALEALKKSLLHQAFAGEL